MRPPALALALLLPLVPGAAAADLEVGGTLAIDEDLVVGAGDTLRLLSGTLVTGPGRLVVHGRLVAEGTPEAPVRFTTRVVLAENASADLVDARFLGASGRALEIDRAAARIVRLVLEGGDEGIFVRDGSLRLHGARVTGLGGAGVLATGAADVEIEDAVFRGTGTAVRAAPTDGGRLRVANSTFVANGRDVDVDVSGKAGVVQLTSNVFAASSAAPSWAAATAGNVRVRGQGDITLGLEGNHFERTALAIRLEGDGYKVAVEGDRFGDCGAVAVADGALDLRFRDAVEECEAGVYASGGARVAGARLSTPRPPGSSTTLWIGVGGAVGAALVVAAGWAVATRDGRARSPLRGDQVGVREAVLGALPPGQETTAAELARAAGVPRAVAERALAALARAGEVEAIGRAVVRWRRRGAEPPLRRMEQVVLDEIRAHPGRAQAEVAQALGLSRQALHYHVKKLEQSGLVVKVTRGRETLCFPAEEGMPPTGRDLS